MGASLASLNVNPCKMCMPMGAVSALYGVRGCMSILHGSQGCATYIRRHMATHYNEPIDIASSSLTEQGTVFGGEANLLKGISNLIELYHPEAIGVCTTCLAETIGEDTAAIVAKFHEQNPNSGVKIINVSSAGYAGTQNEGFFRALRAAVEQAPHNAAPNGKVNIVTPMISPADTRWLKGFLREMGIDAILLPDLSENLDGVAAAKYERLKMGGTSIDDIGKMAGARFTIEFSEFLRAEDSPAAYLSENFSVPYARLALPCGIRGVDALVAALQGQGGELTQEMAKERGRYLDAMVDAHKHTAQARAAVFGDPDFVKAAVRLCCENGIVPVLAATGSVCRELHSLESEIRACAQLQMVDAFRVADDCDFGAIESYCEELGANLMIGSSDGRRAAHRLGLPLVRCAFPIHDYIGGQRVRTLGFDGSLQLLDQVANAMIARTESTYRSELFEKFHSGNKAPAPPKPHIPEQSAALAHPCFGDCASGNARIHLPVAPNCNISCNYCVRKCDCPNESRPGVASEILNAREALERYIYYKGMIKNLAVVGIAGPGDSLANFSQTKETLRLIRSYDPQALFCISTNGLMLPLYAAELKDLGVSHATVTVNAVDIAIGAQIYEFVDYMGTRYTGEAGAAILLANQLAGIKMLTMLGISCKVNSVALKGVNDKHLFEVTKKVRELGADISNIMPHIAVEGSAFEGLERLNSKEIAAIRDGCASNIQQMRHCSQCRADAVGTLGSDVFAGRRQSAAPQKGIMKRFAAATRSGAIVDLHFGQAEEFYIYDSDGNDVRFVEKRKASQYCAGDECGPKEEKWAAALSAIADCCGVLALRIGDAPAKKLKSAGIEPIAAHEQVEAAVRKAAGRESAAIIS
jgi:nitrogenase molybdenum-iron protein alpha/beta subunit/MoaA/NifB/PqqE/SkfB family radical SAM enzyme